MPKSSKETKEEKAAEKEAKKAEKEKIKAEKKEIKQLDKEFKTNATKLVKDKKNSYALTQAEKFLDKDKFKKATLEDKKAIVDGINNILDKNNIAREKYRTAQKSTEAVKSSTLDVNRRTRHTENLKEHGRDAKKMNELLSKNSNNKFEGILKDDLSATRKALQAHVVSTGGASTGKGPSGTPGKQNKGRASSRG